MTGLRSMLSNNSHHLVQGSVPPSKVQRGRVGIPGDFSVLEVRVVEITEGIYDLSPQNCSWCCLTVTESLVLPPKSGPPASMGN